MQSHSKGSLAKQIIEEQKGGKTSRILFFGFHGAMLFWFLIAFLFPIETNYWFKENSSVFIWAEIGAISIVSIILWLMMGLRLGDLWMDIASIIAIPTLSFAALFSMYNLISKISFLVIIYIVVSSAIKAFSQKQYLHKKREAVTGAFLSLIVIAIMLVYALLQNYFKDFTIETNIGILLIAVFYFASSIFLEMRRYETPF